MIPCVQCQNPNLKGVHTCATGRPTGWLQPIAGTPSTMLGEALGHLQRAHDLTMQAHAQMEPVYADIYVKTQVAKVREFIETLKRHVAMEEGACHHGRFLCSECHANKPEAKP